VDVRLIAATNRNLEEEVRERRFREDLLYRINVFKIHVPPLRERKEDISPLAHHFMQRFAVQLGKRARALSPETEQILQACDFPGNVRQLRNLVEQAVILMKSDVLEADCLRGVNNPSTDVLPSVAPASQEERTLQQQMSRIEQTRQELDEQERRLIDEALRTCHGNKSNAARLLGITRFALQRRLNH